MVFLFILLIILIVTLIIITSKIEIKIINLVIQSQRENHIKDGYEIILKLNILGNIPIIKFTMTKPKLKKIQNTLKMKEKIKKLEKDIWDNRNKIDVNFVEIMKAVSKGIHIEDLNIRTTVGTENAFLTAILVAIFSSIFSIGISRLSAKEDRVKYKIEPIYMNQNFIKIAISGIFQIKVIHIINIIYVFNKKGGMKNHERTSNRRSYDYSYE